MKNISNLCILNCVEDAKCFLSEFRYSLNEWTIVSTHSSVNDFLVTKELNCLELSSLITDDFLIHAFQKADITVKTLLKHMDKLYAQNISNILEIQNINYFYPLYVYLGKYEYLNMLKLKKSLDILFDKNLYDRILVYRPIGASYFDNDDIFIDIMKKCSDNHCYNVELREKQNYKYKKKINDVQTMLVRGIKNPKRIFLSIKEYIIQYFPKNINQQNDVILLLEPLYDLNFLKNELKENNVLIWSDKRFPRIDGIKPYLHEWYCNINLIVSELSSVSSSELKQSAFTDSDVFSENIVKHFLNNITKNILPLLYINHLHRQNSIALALWGNSPITGSKALIVEYLLMNKIPVVGMQHGGSYVVQKCMDVHFDSDFSRCSHYFSYGFDAYDMEKTYPDKPYECKIIPVGSYRGYMKNNTERSNDNKETIDILFPITNSLSIFQDGFRVNPSVLHRYQKELIEYLDSNRLQKMRTFIKPLSGYSDENCSTIEMFRRLKNSKLLTNITLVECLEKFRVKAVVMEYPSTPLFEVLGENLDIFLLADPILPFTPEALTLLRKRVHYFENINELKDSLTKYTEGKIPGLRNDEFYHKYVCRKNTKHLILETINLLRKN